MSLVSVILCCEEDEIEHLEPAIESFNDQDWPHRELIVVSPVKLPLKNSIIAPSGRDSMINAGARMARGEFCVVWTPGFRYYSDALRVQLGASSYRDVVTMCQADDHVSFSFARRNAAHLNSEKLGRLYVDSGHTGFVDKVWTPPDVKPPDLEGFGKPGALNLICPAGIGDVLWILGKFSEIARNRDVVFWLPDGEQHRAGGLCRMAGVQYAYLPALTTSWVWDQPDMVDLPEYGWAVIQANRHLEAGRHLREWYPELPLVYPKMHNTFQPRPRPDYVVGFMCLSTYMGGQLPPKVWGSIFNHIEKTVGPVLLVGAGKDVEFAREVSKHYRSPIPPLYDHPLEEVFPTLLNAKAVVGVASGLLITSIVYGVPSLISYPKHLSKMPGTWEPATTRWQWCFHENLPETVESNLLLEILR